MYSSWRSVASLAVWTLVLAAPFHRQVQCKKSSDGDVAVPQQIESSLAVVGQEDDGNGIDPLLMDEYADYGVSREEKRDKKYAQTPVCIESRCLDKILASYPHPTPIVVNQAPSLVRPSQSQYVKTIPSDQALPAIDPRSINDGSVEQGKSAISNRQTGDVPSAGHDHVVPHKNPEKELGKPGISPPSAPPVPQAYSGQHGHGLDKSHSSGNYGHPGALHHQSTNYGHSGSIPHQSVNYQAPSGPSVNHPQYQSVYSQPPRDPYHPPQGSYSPGISPTAPQQYSSSQSYHQSGPSYQPPPPSYQPPQPLQPPQSTHQGPYSPNPISYSSPVSQPPNISYNPPPPPPSPQSSSPPQTYSPPHNPPPQNTYSPSQPSSNYNKLPSPPAPTYEPSSPSYSPPPSSNQYSPPPTAYSQTKPADHKHPQSTYSSGTGYSPAPVNNYSPPQSAPSSGYSNSQPSYTPPVDQYSPVAPSAQQYSPPTPQSESKPYQPSSSQYQPPSAPSSSNYNPPPPSIPSPPQSPYNPPSSTNYSPPSSPSYSPPSAPSEYKPDQGPFSPAPSYNSPPSSYSPATTPSTYSRPHPTNAPITYKSVYGDGNAYREAAPAMETSTSQTSIRTTTTSSPNVGQPAVKLEDLENEPVVATFKEPFHYFGDIKPVDTSRGEEEYRSGGGQVQEIDIEVEEGPVKIPEVRNRYEDHPPPPSSNYHHPHPPQGHYGPQDYHQPPPYYQSPPHCDCSGNTFNFYQAPPEPVYHENTCGHSLIFSCSPSVAPAPCHGNYGEGDYGHGDYGHVGGYSGDYGHQPGPEYGEEFHQPHSHPAPQIDYHPQQQYERQPSPPQHPHKEPIRYKSAPVAATTPQYRNTAEDEVKADGEVGKTPKAKPKDLDVGSKQAIVVQPGYTFGEDPATIKAKVEEIEKPKSTTTSTSSPLRNEQPVSYIPSAPFGSGLSFMKPQEPAERKAEPKVENLLDKLKERLSQMGGTI